MRLLAVLVLPLLAVACAGQPPFEVDDVRSGLTPTRVAEGSEVFQGERVLWGGTIVDVRNESERTVIEVLSYPLDDDQRPDTTEAASGRFLAVKNGFLDPADYAAGRRITVKGNLGAAQEGRVGEAAYTYPVVMVDELQLWTEVETRSSREPRVNFGIGIIFSN